MSSRRRLKGCAPFGLLSEERPQGLAVFYHVAVGLFFVHIGSLQQDEEAVRSMVLGTGTLLVLVKGVTSLFPLLFLATVPILRGKERSSPGIRGGEKG